MSQGTPADATPADEGAPELSLSALIESVLNDADSGSVRLGDLIDRTAERGFGVLLVILGTQMLIPFLPPGSSTIVGPIYAAFAVQMLRGARRPWVPQRFRDHVLSAQTVQALRRRGVPWIRRAERWSRPRGFWLGERLTLRVVGVMVFIMGIILLSPLPFLNTLPAISVMLLGTALINQDLLFMVAGVMTGGISIGLIGLSAGVIFELIARVRSVYFR